MSKSLGTGIDPLDEIEAHGADALRFGLLAMSSTQDVRYSAAKVQQGRDLANKMWNASRLILLNAADRASPRRPRRRGPLDLSRLQRAIGSVDREPRGLRLRPRRPRLYAFFWSELCDWYLEIVKPRLYEGEEEAAARPAVGPRAGARPGPPGDAVRHRGDLGLPALGGDGATRSAGRDPRSPRPTSRCSTRTPSARSRRRSSSPARVRRWRDLVGVRRRRVLPARVGRGGAAAGAGRRPGAPFLRRRARASRWRRSARSRSSPTRSTRAGRRRIDGAPRGAAREVERAERKLANEGFVAKAPRPRWSRPSATSSPPTGPSSRSWPRPLTAGRPDAEAYLVSLEPLGWRFGLERIRRLVSVLGMPQPASPRSTSSAPTASRRWPR